MLENPSYGWARWDLPNFRDRISYIDDFPFMLLKSLIEYFETGREQEVRFDAEGWHYFFTFNENVVVEGKVLYDSVEEFAADLIHDLEKDLHGWADFPSRRDSDYDELVKLLSDLKKHLPKEENAFVKFIENRIEKINNPEIDEEIRNKYFKEFEELNTTTSSIYDLGDLEVLIILKDGTNLTSWSDVEDKNDILYVSEDLSNKTSLSYRYDKCNSLESIVVTGVTDKVYSLSFMFERCNSLQYVFGMDSWDISNLKNMDAMFLDCFSLTDISFLESLDVSNVNEMESMFQNCISLSDISPLGSWNVRNVENMHAMFALCLNLHSLKGLQSWDVGNVKNMESLFHQCMELADISYLKDWKLNSIENMYEMFRECISLENTDALNEWDIGGDVNMESMFKDSNVNEPEWYSNSTNEIEEHIKSIDDEETLIDIAYNHSNYIARKYAVERITDEDVLKDIVEKCSDIGIFEAAVKNEHLTDEEFLINQLEDGHVDIDDGSFIVNRFVDEDYLTKIAKGNFLLKYRMLAINKISEKSVLEDLVKNDENRTIRNFASKRLNAI